MAQELDSSEPLYAMRSGFTKSAAIAANGLYAEINKLRGQLPRLAAPDVRSVCRYLEDSPCSNDERLRLRCLVIKGETDVDLDPSRAEQSGAEVLELAEKLGEPAGRSARGELGLVSFLQATSGSSVIKLGQSAQGAEIDGDVASCCPLATLFGHGYVELGRP